MQETEGAAMSDHKSGGAGGRTGRELALINYGLLFAAALFAGIPALVAVVIAYVSRERAGPDLRPHYTSQIRIFWIGALLSLAAGACLLGAMAVAAVQLFEVGEVSGWTASEIDLASVLLEGPLLGLLLGGLGLATLAGLWLMIASLVGFVRLASAPAMGESAGS
jgi:uncharacterized membrane protein